MTSGEAFRIWRDGADMITVYDLGLLMLNIENVNVEY